MRVRTAAFLLFLAVGAVGSQAKGQMLGKPDRAEPGDVMIQEHLARQTKSIGEDVLGGARSAADWEKLRPGFKEEYFYMLGLWPLPPKTPLEAKITGTLPGQGYVVDMIHYQSRPHLYVTGNLYRPAEVKPGQRLPAVFYVCGHSGMGRNGNKSAYQSHGIWFARHGYICLVVDSLQLGEIGAIHHGTYREGRWWWHARGYTPAGVECWNGVRGIDYLTSRPDVDPERIAVTGISGGGAATFWISAADERVKAAVPVSGMADLESYVPNLVINGHCDCMFLYNTFQWPWTRIAAMIAPRALLFANSDNDPIFPMDANHRVSARMEKVYALLGKPVDFGSFVSVGGHAYRQDIRQAAYRFINTHVKNDSRPVTDSEVDLIQEDKSAKRYPIEPDKLRVFPKDSDIPKDELNTKIDQHFVPLARPAAPGKGQFDAWKAGLQKELRRVAFRCFPERIPQARLSQRAGAEQTQLETEPGITVGLHRLTKATEASQVKRVLLVVEGSKPAGSASDWLKLVQEKGDEVYVCEPRGVGSTRWTRKNPPNYVQRCHVLLGLTVDAGRVWDIIAAARYLCAEHQGKVPVYVAGQRAAGVLAAYAALWEPEIAGVILSHPPRSHMETDAPQFLNVLRVCDIPDVLGMLAPRPLTVYAKSDQRWERTAAAYGAADSAAAFAIRRGDAVPSR
jgi:dienelactone hydrolase